jgi:tetratricopeptide (TPR) repeat protein
MRPDSKLYIVPAAGGVARRMTCNTPLMNSWHSFSPNGRWLVFSSKSRSPYTQMFLTHIDAEGNDTPAILIENSTAANRAVNIPEFVNMDRPAASSTSTRRRWTSTSSTMWRGAGEEGPVSPPRFPSGPRHGNEPGRCPRSQQLRPDAGTRWQGAGGDRRVTARSSPPSPSTRRRTTIWPSRWPARAMAMRPSSSTAIGDRAESGLCRGAQQSGPRAGWSRDGSKPSSSIEEAVAINPEYAEAHNNLGFALPPQGRLDEAVSTIAQAIESDPRYAHAYNNLGLALAMQGKIDEAIGDFSKAIELDPAYASAEANLGHALLSTRTIRMRLFRTCGRQSNLRRRARRSTITWGKPWGETSQTDEAITNFERALQLSPSLVEAHYYLGVALAMKGRRAEGLAHWRQALLKEPDNVQVLNEIAWVLATAPEAALRNGSEAVSLAEHAVKLTSAREPVVLGTLAAAYAETGRYGQATETEQRAADLAARQGNAPLAESLNQRLTLFERKTPIRQQ